MGGWFGGSIQVNLVEKDMHMGAGAGEWGIKITLVKKGYPRIVFHFKSVPKSAQTQGHILLNIKSKKCF